MTYEKIKKRYSYQGIVLSGSELALIADDSDYHRTRKGYMKYDSMILVRLGEKTWALGKGKAWGSYPADPYDSDILVLEMRDEVLRKAPEKIAEEIMPWIRMSYVFSNSIIAG